MSALLVASTGGHLVELIRLRPRLTGLGDAVTWVTFDTPQSRSMLEGEEVVFVRDTPPRDAVAVAANTVRAAGILRELRPRAVVSTGAGIALSFFPQARARGLECHFIESSARTRSPSLTGRILRRLPGMRLYTQYPQWSSGPWRYAGSVFDGFAAAQRPVPGPVRRVVVTLGTMKFSFRRLVDRLVSILPDDTEVLWQTGAGDTVPPDELAEAIRRADVVIAHAGAGSALTALEAGHLPILVPRLQRFGEHVDDHQLEVAEHLANRGLALARAPEELTGQDLERAASLRVAQSEPPAFELATTRDPAPREAVLER